MSSGELDLNNRDPNNINDHIRVAFSDVLAEPDGAHSIDCVWKSAFCCYQCGNRSSYRLMTCLCGLCIALYWGCQFATITFNMVWCVTPSLRRFAIQMGMMQKYFGTFINCCMAPICETCGLYFSRVTVTNK